MPKSKKSKNHKWLSIPAWIVLCAVIGAVLFWVLLFSRDYRREKEYIRDVFLQRGEVMIHSLELLSRQNPQSSWNQLIDDFWENIADDNRVLFLLVSDDKGNVIHSAGAITPPQHLFFTYPGHRSHQAEKGDGTKDNILFLPDWRLEDLDGRKFLLVYRRLLPPPPRHGMMMRHGGHMRSHNSGSSSTGGMKASATPVFLWIAFDMSIIDKISKRRSRAEGMFISLCALAVLAGVLALFWGYNSRLNKKMYQEANAMASALIGRLPTGVIIKNKAGLVSLVNRATCEISGLQEKDFLGENLETLTFGLIPKEDVLSGREINLRFKGGNSVNVSISGGPIVNEESNERLGHVFLIEDQGEIGRLRTELVKKEKLASLGSLAAGLAHEIRNPLGAIRGLSQHLLGKSSADSNEREALEVMLASVDRLNSTVTDFLEYSKPTDLKLEPLDLSGLVQKMASLVSHDALSRQVEINLDIPEQAIIIDGDESLLSQAFLNLYLNAIQAAAHNQQGQLNVSLKRKNDEAVLCFHDNGPGFSPGQLSQAFVPYFTTKADGTGLGLALVEKTIRAHTGADITLSSPLAGGALINISFKLANRQDERSDNDSQCSSINS